MMEPDVPDLKLVDRSARRTAAMRQERMPLTAPVSSWATHQADGPTCCLDDVSQRELS